MTTLQKRKLILPSFFLILVVLALGGVGAYRQGMENVNAAKWVRHTYEVLGELSATFSSMLDVQAGARGYVITGRDSYLEPYKNATREIGQKIQRLRQLTADNPEQQQRLNALEPLIRRRIEIAQRIINLRRTEGKAVAEQVVSAGEGKQVMDEIRKVIAEMEAAETELLQRRTEELRADNQRTLAIFMFLILVLGVLVVGALFLVRRDIAAKQREIELTRQARTYAENIVDTVREPLLVIDSELRVQSANRSFYQSFQVTPQETRGRLLWELGNGQWNIPELRKQLGDVLPQHASF